MSLLSIQNQIEECSFETSPMVVNRGIKLKFPNAIEFYAISNDEEYFVQLLCSADYGRVKIYVDGVYCENCNGDQVGSKLLKLVG